MQIDRAAQYLKTFGFPPGNMLKASQEVSNKDRLTNGENLVKEYSYGPAITYNMALLHTMHEMLGDNWWPDALVLKDRAAASTDASHALGGVERVRFLYALISRDGACHLTQYPIFNGLRFAAYRCLVSSGGRCSECTPPIICCGRVMTPMFPRASSARYGRSAGRTSGFLESR